jgi:hypothetical protein
MPKVASEASVEETGIGRREEEAREDKHRRRGIDVKVKKLDGGSYHAGEEDLARRIDVPFGRFGCRHPGT